MWVVGMKGLGRRNTAPDKEVRQSSAQGAVSVACYVWHLSASAVVVVAWQLLVDTPEHAPHSCPHYCPHQVVLDLGRQPEARFLGRPGGELLREAPVTVEDLRAAEEAVGAFGRDNRAGGCKGNSARGLFCQHL